MAVPQPPCSSRGNPLAQARDPASSGARTVAHSCVRPDRLIPPSLASALALLALFLLQGCTLIGVGIGASIPRVERVAPQDAKSLPTNIEVEVEAKTGDDVSSGSRAAPIRHIAGNLDSVEGGYIFVASADGKHTRDIPLDRVTELRVDRGTYWLAGLCLGAAIDFAVVVVTYALVTSIPGPDLGNLSVPER